MWAIIKSNWDVIVKSFDQFHKKKFGVSSSITKQRCLSNFLIVPLKRSHRIRKLFLSTIAFLTMFKVNLLRNILASIYWAMIFHSITQNVVKFAHFGTELFAKCSISANFEINLFLLFSFFRVRRQWKSMEMTLLFKISDIDTNKVVGEHSALSLRI